MEPRTPTSRGRHIVLHQGAEAWAALHDRWNELALSGDPSPFLTHEWLSAWWRAYGRGELVCPAVMDGDRIVGAACLARTPLGGLEGPANDHTGDWDVVAADDDARADAWEALAGLGAARVALPTLRAASGSARLARTALRAAGYRVLPTPGPRSPYLELPDTPEALLAAASRNLRSQVGRRKRQLEKEGPVELRTVTTGGPELDAALDALFTLEASGWKAREGTAILREPGAEGLYRDFAAAAAQQGWLRVYLLEVGGRPLAGDLGIAVGGVGFLLKTGFDEAQGRLSPGLVLRGEVLRASIEEGLRGYDFLGPDDDYKLRWAPDVRPRVTLRAFRGPLGLPAASWHGRLRPALKRARDARRSDG